MPRLTLVVMAAGVGSRYGGLKQIEPVGPDGEAILDYSVHDAVAAGFDRVVFIIRRDIEEDFRQILGKRIEGRVDTRYVFQQLDALPEGFSLPEGRTKPWGTGHAVLCSRPEVDGPFAVINADDFYGPSSFRALSDHLSSLDEGEPPFEYCMAGYVLGNTLSEHGYVSRGVCTVSPEGLLERIDERTHIERRGGGAAYTEDDETWHELPLDATVSMNMWGFGPSLFEALGSRFPAFLKERITEAKSEFFLPTVVMEMLSEGTARARVLPTAERWVGVTHKEDVVGVREAIGRLIDDGAYPRSLWATS